MTASTCPSCGNGLDAAAQPAACPACGQSLAQASAAPAGSAAESRLIKRLRVVDGADQGRCFTLADQGTQTVGNSSKHAAIWLHDLYVARTHCQIEVDGDRVVVIGGAASHPTLVNGVPIQRHEMQLGDVLRVGNSYLALEQAAAARSAPAAIAPAGPAKLPRLTGDRSSELNGHTLGHYEVGEVLGRGHFGVVFKSRDVKTRQLVALKVLSPDFPANDAEMRQFAEAMRAALPVRHPSLVTLHGAGKTGPYCWIDRELIEGESLAQLIVPNGRGPRELDWRLALRVAVHVGQALNAIHQHHLAHCNITPRNIMIRRQDQQVKLGDLLFRKSVEGSALWRATHDKKFAAELPYLAPEQTDPGAYVDDLCDLYSLGVVLYALLTGSPPFAARTQAETLRQVREDLPLRPKLHQHSVPPEFQDVVLKMLAKHQEDRYATPAALLADLARLAERRKVSV